MFAVHSRITLFKHTSMLSEVGMVRDTVWGGGKYGVEFYTFNQSYTRLLRGLFLMLDVETLTQKNPSGGPGELHTLMLGPSLVWILVGLRRQHPAAGAITAAGASTTAAAPPTAATAATHGDLRARKNSAVMLPL